MHVSPGGCTEPPTLHVYEKSGPQAVGHAASFVLPPMHVSLESVVVPVVSVHVGPPLDDPSGAESAAASPPASPVPVPMPLMSPPLLPSGGAGGVVVLLLIVVDDEHAATKQKTKARGSRTLPR